MTSSRIWKYEIPRGKATFGLTMPAGAQILSVAVQPRTGPVLWALVDPRQRLVYRAFRLVETGEPIRGAHRLDYVGTFVTLFDWPVPNELTSPYVGHIFEELVPE